MSKTRIHLFVSGRVQGVGFRASARRRAGELGVGGWIKNLPDGRVEAVAEGPERSVEKMVRWCRRGPRRAEVENIEIGEETVEGLEGFEVRF